MIMSTSWNPWHGCFLFSPNRCQVTERWKTISYKTILSDIAGMESGHKLQDRKRW